MKTLRDPEIRYWQEYLQTKPLDMPINPNISASYAGNKDTTDKLLHLYLIGKKTAGSSLVQDFISAGDRLPQIGNFWILLDSQDVPRCILRTERVVFNKFNNVSEEISQAEGEGDLSLDYWRKTHKFFFSPFLEQWGLNNIEDATVVTEFFKIVYK